LKITLAGHWVVLEPLNRSHQADLLAAAADGELWKLEITVVPNHAMIADYLSAALRAHVSCRLLSGIALLVRSAV